MWNVPHIQYECGEYFVKYCQTQKNIVIDSNNVMVHTWMVQRSQIMKHIEFTSVDNQNK